MKHSSAKHQIWFPGSSNWELWQISRRKAPKLIATESNSSQLKFKRNGGQKILALPIADLEAQTFISAAFEEKKLRQGAEDFLKKQACGEDIKGIGMQPIHGFPPRTQCRIDVPKIDSNHNFPKDLEPDQIVPSASLLKVPRHGVGIWCELGKLCAAFSRAGLTASYVAIQNRSEADLASALQETVPELTQTHVINKPQQINCWGLFDQNPFTQALGIPAQTLERPAPDNLKSIVSLCPERLHEDRNQKRAGRRRIKQAIAIGVGATMAIIIAIAFIYFSTAQTRTLRHHVADLEESAKEIVFYKEQWQEVAMAVDPSASLLENWRDMVMLPSSTGVRISNLAICNREIELSGQASSINQALSYIDKVRKNNELREFTWDYENPEIESDGYAHFSINGLKQK